MRGFRIELGEITEVLGAHPALRFAHTEVRDIAGPARIVSYVQAADAGAVIDVDALRAHVAEHLPAHMVPSSVTVLDRIPLTPVGKLDRAALPEPRQIVVAAREPSTDGERLVAQVMAELIGADTVGADDNFFDIGGNSLLATQLVARLTAATGPGGVRRPPCPGAGRATTPRSPRRRVPAPHRRPARAGSVRRSNRCPRRAPGSGDPVVPVAAGDGWVAAAPKGWRPIGSAGRRSARQPGLREPRPRTACRATAAGVVADCGGASPIPRIGPGRPDLPGEAGRANSGRRH
ncbi:phosphopantetheine-binding protein [Micromonospora sp. NPDC048843]|uniref:phosphopantetheine-binding protein n=1 Tax=Micromonospora sp. NPDC048843 TaxID=3155389 RepID=UPI0034025547